MRLLRPAATRRFRPESLFQPRSVVLVGGDTPLGARIGANLEGFKGGVERVEAGVGTRADLAVLACAPEAVAGALLALGQAGTFAAVCATPAP